MSTQAAMTERHAAALAEFAALCLVSARDLAARQVAAECADDAASLASALHRVGRSLRQSLALEAKLRRDLELGSREAAAQAVRDDEKRRAHRKLQVRTAVERLVWNEARDADEAEDLIEDLSALLDAEAVCDDFGEEPLGDHIARVRGLLVAPAPEPGPPEPRSPRPQPASPAPHPPAPRLQEGGPIPQTFVMQLGPRDNRRRNTS